MSLRRVPQSRAERIIAVGRLFLALASFGAIYLDPLEPSLHPTFTYAILGGYAAYSLAVAMWTAAAPATTTEWIFVSHCIDLTVFGTINYMTFGPTSPFFIYFVFSIICAMLRFGRRGTLLTAAGAMIVFTASLGRVLPANFELNRFIIRLAYLGVMASMLYYLATYQEKVQHDLQRIARWPRSPRHDRDELVLHLMNEAASIFGSKRVLLVYAHLTERFAFFGEQSADGFDVTQESHHIADALLERDSGTFAGNVSIQSAHLSFDESTHGRKSRAEAVAGIPAEIVRRYRIDDLVATSFHGEFVRGRLLLLDGGLPLLEEINLARIAGGVIAGRLDHFHAEEQLQRGAVAEERVRVARDLHDSILQSLTGVALQLRTLPRLMTADPEEARRRFAEIEQVLVAGQKELRWFIDALRPGHTTRPEPEGLGERLSTLAQRFREQWALEIENQVSPLVHMLPMNTRYEIYAIVSEAVANAAKHAGAHRVKVAIDADDDAVRIDVRDDGKGFPFFGRFSLDELIAGRRGPVTLKERVAALRGAMILESLPSGSALTIRLPLRTPGV